MDPLIEYKQEAFKSFQELMAAIQRDIVASLFHLNLEAVSRRRAPTHRGRGRRDGAALATPYAPGSGRQGGEAQVAAATGDGGAAAGSTGPARAAPPAGSTRGGRGEWGPGTGQRAGQDPRACWGPGGVARGHAGACTGFRFALRPTVPP